ncbi:MAG: PorT family protein [Fibromonadaceae bacterium]|jgi:hypothetical protein|nr:PorT family protein [Fibromonadaceae bacterium]
MNTLKKFMFAAAFLCAATVVNAGNSMKVGARLSYSMQSIAYDRGMLGLGAGLAVDAPIGPIFFSPELAFLYRNNWSTTLKLLDFDENIIGTVDYTQPEFAISIPLMFKFLYIAAGVQIDIPIAPKECFDNDCLSMNGKETINKRSDYDLGIVFSFNHIITPNLALDFRYVYGTRPHHTTKLPGTSLPDVEIKSKKMDLFSFGIKYFFL